MLHVTGGTNITSSQGSIALSDQNSEIGDPQFMHTNNEMSLAISSVASLSNSN